MSISDWHSIFAACFLSCQVLPLPPPHLYCGGCEVVKKWGNHRDRYLEQQQTEKIETEVRDVDRIQIK